MRVTTNFNGSDRTYDMGRHTVVVGPTGSGKTTLLSSLSLLLAGAADDTAGRVAVASAADLALAMAEGQEEIQIALDLEGRTHTVSVPRGKRPVHTGASPEPWRHPVRVLKELLAKGPDAARAELAPLLLGDAPIAVHRLVPPQVHPFVPPEMRVGDIVSLLAAREEGLKGLKKQRQELEQQVQGAEKLTPTPPAPETIEAARRAAVEAQERLGTQATARAEQAQRAAARRQCEDAVTRLRTRAEALRVEYAQVQAAQEAQAQQEPSDPQGLLGPADLDYVNAALVILGRPPAPEQCPFCATKVGLAPLRDAFRGALARHESAVEATRSVLPAPTTRDLPTIAAEYQATATAYAEAGAALLALPPADLELPAEDLSTAAMEAARVLATLEATQRAYATTARMRAELLQLQEQVGQQELLVQELRRLLDNVFRERVAAAEEGVSRWLPKGYGLRLLLHDSKGARIFRLGLVLPEGDVSTNPSGGQRSALLLAMVVYLIEQGRIPASTPESPVVVMLPEERGFSPKWLGLVMHALAGSSTPIVLASLHKPTGYRGAAWTVVNLEERTKVEAEVARPGAEEAG